MAEQETTTHHPMLPRIVETVGRSAEPSYGTEKQEYDVTQHDVMNPARDKRPKKKVKKPMLGHDGKTLKNEDGTTKFTTDYIEVNRTALPLQQLIVNRRVSFMNVGKMQLECNPKDKNEERLYGMVRKTREDNKMEFIEKEVARRMLSELQVAKLYYTQPVDPGYWGDLSSSGKHRIRCQILSPEKGDQLLPVFDEYGQLVYFGRIYKSKRSFAELLSSPTLIGADELEDERFDIYSKTHIYKFRKARAGESVVSTENNNGWVLDGTPFAHSYGKIPIIYYSKPAPPWASVQHVIERIETLLSNFGDTNDYHASPVFVMMGNVGAKMLEKGEQGKSLQITGDKADAKYVTWEQATEAVKLELDTLVDFAFTCTQTPQMSMEDLKGLGAASGVAYDRIFIDAHLAARDELDGEYGMGTQRSINLETALCVAIDKSLELAGKSIEIKYDVPIFRINDDAETIGTLAKANSAGMLSQKTMVEYSPLTKNAEEELAQIQKEKQEDAEAQAKAKALAPTT